MVKLESMQYSTMSEKIKICINDQYKKVYWRELLKFPHNTKFLIVDNNNANNCIYCIIKDKRKQK